jgi:hypothetical protein
MLFRAFPPAATVALLAVLVAVTPGRAADGHRNGFAGKTPFFVRGDANIHADEKSHAIDNRHARNAGTSEYIKIEANPAPGTDAEYVHYYYETPPAPITADTVARLWVKGYRVGTQLKARVVLPKERDPKNPDSALTLLIAGDSYNRTHTWQQLSLGDPSDALRRTLPVLTARLGRTVDTTGAYIDQLVLNVYTGAGVSEVWVDDLEIAPVERKAEGVGPRGVGAPTARGKGKAPTVEFSNGDILVDDKPFFMRAIRHTDTPLRALEIARFNTIWFPGDVAPAVYEEAIAAKFFIVPSLPLPAADWDPARPNQTAPAVLAKDAELVTKHLRKFLSGDAVLMWDLGYGRTSEQVRRVGQLANIVKTYDPKRPRAVDLWDGHQAYSNYVDAIGAHRWPLFTSLSLPQYRDWLAQRRALTGPGKLNWTWVQTHLPEWYIKLNTGLSQCDHFDDPIGPHPEQIRTLTYLAVAAGYRGLGFWSDRFLAESHHGQDRLLEIFQLNAELELLEPVLMKAIEPATWIATDHPSVFAAVIRGPKEVIVLPVWLGEGDQFCPQQATVPAVTMVVKLVPDGAQPWSLSAAGVSQIKTAERVPAGTRITIPEFDTAAAIVFTADLALDGKVVKWQDLTRNKLARTAAQYARQQAHAQFVKALAAHQNILAAGGPPVEEAADLFERAAAAMRRASLYTDNGQPDLAYREARRALRPLRVLMRTDWQKAVESLDVPTASPYAVSVYSLPKHYELKNYIQNCRPGGNGLSHGGFELKEKAPAGGAAVSSLPGWVARKTILDAVVGTASIVNSDTRLVADPDPGYAEQSPARYAPGRPVPTAQDAVRAAPTPTLGNHVLQFTIVPKPDPDAKPGERPQALERSFLAVDSPPAEFPPGTWVRIRFWAKLGTPVAASADGALVYDSVGGEPLAVRLTQNGRWKQYHLYRQVPESGKINVTFALTGIGIAFFDDVAIEPMIPFGNTSARPPVPTPPKPQLRREDDRTLPFPRQTDQLPPPRPAK